MHNRWEWHWTLIVTLFGWLAVIGGIVRMAAPQVVEQIGLRIIAHHTFFLMDGWVVVLFGVLLSYCGYLNPPNLSPARAARGLSRRR